MCRSTTCYLKLPLGMPHRRKGQQEGEGGEEKEHSDVMISARMMPLVRIILSHGINEFIFCIIQVRFFFHTVYCKSQFSCICAPIWNYISFKENDMIFFGNWRRSPFIILGDIQYVWPRNANDLEFILYFWIKRNSFNRTFFVQYWWDLRKGKFHFDMEIRFLERVPLAVHISLLYSSLWAYRLPIAMKN